MPELDIGGGALSIIQVLIDSFNDVELGCLAILLCDPKCPSNQFLWVYDGHLWLCAIAISNIIVNV